MPSISQDTGSKAPETVEASKGKKSIMPGSSRFRDISIVGPGSDPRTNKKWMGDTVLAMKPGWVPAISGEKPLSREELAKMGVNGERVKVGGKIGTKDKGRG